MDEHVDCRSLKLKKGANNSNTASHPKSTAPTTFLLKKASDLDKSTQQRGRKTSRASASSSGVMNDTEMASRTDSSSFGVQSLEETIGSAHSSQGTLSRTSSNSTDHGYDESGDTSGVGRKRRSGNIHPTISQRIMSLERHSQGANSHSSPLDSPLRHSHLRRSGSATSSVNMSQPLTPLRLSPRPEPNSPSTPRSTSPRSFRLSDEDSVAEDSSSQAIVSESGDEDHAPSGPTPQLVMPSLAVPIRRPFTQQGKRIGRAKVMVVGPKSVGKTSFISNVFRLSEDIVHMDANPSGSFAQPPINADSTLAKIESGFVENYASTRPCAPWRTDIESSRKLQSRRKSVGEGALDRNLTFIDTPALEDDRTFQHIVEYVGWHLRRAGSVESMSDGELVSLLSGDGSLQVDAVFYIFEPVQPSQQAESQKQHRQLLQFLCRYTNLIPVVGKADQLTEEDLQVRKQQISDMLATVEAEPYRLIEHSEAGAHELVEPLAISSALEDDGDVIDASLLMSSQYMQPLIASEMELLTHRLLLPENVARMRHASAVKYLLWRLEHDDASPNEQQQIQLQSPVDRSRSPGVASTGSLQQDPSKVLVPHSTSSYYRSVSPATSEGSLPSTNASACALARLGQQAQPPEPFRQVRLAKWAHDLQRSINNERLKYHNMVFQHSLDSSSDDDDKSDARALVTTKDRRPTRGRLGGDFGVIDPRDPLGVLALGQTLRQRGFVVLQFVSGFGLLGTIAYWVVKNWADVQDFLCIGQNPSTMSATTTPPPVRSGLGWIDDNNLRGFFGWDK